MESGIEQLDLEVLVKYVVNEDEYQDALVVIEKHKKNYIAIKVFRSFYSNLPDAIEEMVCDLRVVAEKQGVFLFGLKTTAHQYLYLGSEEETLFIGDYEKGVKDEDILLYFGYKNEQDFLDKLPKSFESLETLIKEENKLTTCVACGVTEGEHHIFGCPIEQCPWCDGQLNRCNCRFDQLGVDEIVEEELLERFEEMLQLKGRIAFNKEQSPSYPVGGDDRGPGEK